MIKHCLKKYAMTAVFLGSIIQPAAAYGGWHSGGGELFTDAGNPWFVQNTESIRYCIEIDEVNFGQERAVVDSKIRAAFDYWKREFQLIDYWPWLGIPPKDMLLATQTLLMVTCQEQHDLTFQFGVLSEQQAQFLRFPEKVVAKSVRTEYDPKILKGKGFIYVSPETGPYALKGPGPWGSILPNRWRHAMGRNLEMVLAHELGHIFGIQHISLDEHAFNLMAEDFPALMISLPFGDMITPEIEMPWFFARDDDLFSGKFHYEWKGGGHRPYTDRILEIPADTKKGMLELRPSEDKSRLELVNFSEPEATPQLIGTFFGKSTAMRLVQFGWIYVTPAQQVFTGIPPEGTLRQLFFQGTIERSMIYIPARGGSGIPVGIRTRGNVATFLTVFDNKFHFEFFEMTHFKPFNWASFPLSGSSLRTSTLR